MALIHVPQTTENTVLLPVFEPSESNRVLNNVSCVKSEVLENYIEQFSHFSTV